MSTATLTEAPRSVAPATHPTWFDDAVRDVDGPPATSPSAAPQRRPTPVRSRTGGSVADRWQIRPPHGGGSVVVQEYRAGFPGRPPGRHGRTARAGHGRPRPVQLTARGRAVLCLAVLALVCAAFSVGRASAAASATGTRPVPTVVVQPGQTLWQIAGEVAPDRDRRSTVAGIVRLNPDSADGVQPGETLRVPVR